MTAPSPALTRGTTYAQTWAEAQHHLTAAGYRPDLAEFICEQAAIDHPGYGMAWVLAVAGDVHALLAEPLLFDDSGAE